MNNRETQKTGGVSTRRRFLRLVYAVVLSMVLSAVPVAVFGAEIASKDKLELTGRDRAELLYKDSIRLAGEGEIAKAVEAIHSAIAIESYASYHDHLGHLLLRKGDLDGALGAFQTALKLDPRSHTSKTGMGLVHYKKGDLKAAEEALKAALVLNPYPSMTHYALGLVYEKLSDYEQALKHYKEGIRTIKVRIGKE